MRNGSLINQLMEQSRGPTPVVGMGATQLFYTDRAAGTIVEVSADGKSVWFQQDVAKRTDSNGMSECQSYEYWPDPSAPKMCYTLRGTGQWVKKGEPTKHGLKIMLGLRQTYHDYSF